MTINVDKAFEVNAGLLVNDESSGNTVEGPFVTGGPNNPMGLNLPERTLYIQTKPTGVLMWRKFGNGVNDWLVHENSIRTGTVDHDIYVPENEVVILGCAQYDGDIIVDGEAYFL